VSDVEIERLALRQQLSPEEFRAVYTRSGRRGRIDLRDKADGDCVFFDEERGCTVYEDRPSQCRTYPFWRSVLHDPESWEVEAGRCEGIGRGEPVATEVIEELLDPRK
jgi:Fe-S-cluster containining protein